MVHNKQTTIMNLREQAEELHFLAGLMEHGQTDAASIEDLVLIQAILGTELAHMVVRWRE